MVSSTSDPATAASSYESARPAPAFSATSHGGSTGGQQSNDEILKSLERIADLHQKGILSDEEFKSKKAELLAEVGRISLSRFPG